MTRFGVGVLIAGIALAVLGGLAHWAPVTVMGIAMVVIVAGSVAHVLRRPHLALDRAVEPPRVEKGLPAIAVVHVTNMSRRSVAPLTIEQRLGDEPIRAVLPRLRRGEQGLRTYRLPTSHRGVYDIGPVEIPRADPFGLCRTVQRMGEAQRIAVHPRLLSLHSLPTGISRNLEGPSSDTSPQGTVTFHRLREYVVGDDLRTIHWLSTARAGKLVVRHNVDTAQPYTVVLTDLNPDGYSAETFEEAIDVTASLLVSMSVGKSPVQVQNEYRRSPGRTVISRSGSFDRLSHGGQSRPQRLAQIATGPAPSGSRWYGSDRGRRQDQPGSASHDRGAAPALRPRRGGVDGRPVVPGAGTSRVDDRRSGHGR